MAPARRAVIAKGMDQDVNLISLLSARLPAEIGYLSCQLKIKPPDQSFRSDRRGRRQPSAKPNLS
jgi:hypothetical protein